MIATEAEYEETTIVIDDLKSQYKELSAINKKRPYIGQQMAREIHRLTVDAKRWEYDRFETLTRTSKD